jgi:hypothetical protein
MLDGIDCLDEKYKTSYRVENALKRKRKKKSESLAPLVPVSSEPKTVT